LPFPSAGAGGAVSDIAPQYGQGIDFINAKGYLNYYIRQDRINDYLKSLLDLANLLTHNAIYLGARDEVIDDVIRLIRSYVEELHRSGRYDTLADQVLQFKLSVQVFDPFGEALQEHYFSDFTMMSETDLDRQVRNADAKLGRYGFPNIYGGRYYDEDDPNAHKIQKGLELLYRQRQRNRDAR
jgi:type III restriction enzyme